MDLAASGPDATVFTIECLGALLFGLVFLFLWRQSRIVYFGLWAAAWATQVPALMCGYQLLHTQSAAWLAPYAVLEFTFAILLVAAARAGFAGPIRDWRMVLRLIALLPIFVALVYAFGWSSRAEGYHASHSLMLCLVYFYNFTTLSETGRIGGRVFRFSLLMLSIAFLAHTLVLILVYRAGSLPQWTQYLRFGAAYDFALNSVLTFAAMGMWIESQSDRVRQLADELAAVRRDNATMDLDRLTGLLNQAALEDRMNLPEGFDGVVAVCDMDHFKEINDRYGHLVGDEILRNIGHLLRASIRQQDLAFRWGGDEFVILFANQHVEVVRKRMEGIQERLGAFHVRGHGVLPISFSWGAVEAQGRPLRDVVDEADHGMLRLKRARPE